MSHAAAPSLNRSTAHPFAGALPAVLPDDPEALKTLLQAQQAAFIAHLAAERVAAQQAFQAQREADQKAFEARLLQLYEQIRLARQRQFGRSSEAHPGQAGLFDEAEAETAASPEAADSVELPAPATRPTSAVSTTRRRGKRQPLPPELPRIEVIHEVPEAERCCPCGTPLVEIGEEISEQLDIVPMQVRVLRHIRKRYGCPQGDTAPQVAAVPPQVLPKSNASNDLLAMLLTTKYVDGLPLARFEYILGRAGVAVPRQTLARWVIGTAQALQPIANLLRDHLLGGDIIHMDETPVQVLKEPGRAASSDSYMWVQRGGPPGHPAILFDYDPSRSGQVPLRLLEGWQGYLMTDGWDAYNAVVAKQALTHLGCWAHARRYFVEAAKLLPPGKSGHAAQALTVIARLYAIEKTHRDRPEAERLSARQTASQAVLLEFRAWLDAVRPTVPPGTALGKALGYLHQQWPRLIRYIERGDLPMDNNAAENAIRPFVVGRKAWLFADTPAGANASALIYSLVETAKANGLEPYLWLRHVLRNLPTANTVEHFEALLPWNCNLGNLATA
jgi:transposase